MQQESIPQTLISQTNAQPFSPVRDLHLPLSCKRWMLTKIIRLELSEKLFTQTRQYNTKLHDPNKTKMGIPCFEWRWLLNYEHVIVFRVFIFITLFRNAIREQLDENDFRRCYSIFFPKVSFLDSLIITWLQLCSEFFINNYEVPWQQHLKDTLRLKILWTWMSSLLREIYLIIVCFFFSHTSLVFNLT